MSKRKGHGRANRRRVQRHRARLARRLGFRITGSINPRDSWFVIDDPLDASEAATPEQRQRALGWWREAPLSARASVVTMPPIETPLPPEPVLGRGPCGESVVVLPPSDEPPMPVDGTWGPSLLEALYSSQLDTALSRLRRNSTRR